MSAEDTEAAVRAAVRFSVDAVARVLDGDPHNWSARPCETCRLVTSVLGRPFGCDRVRQERIESMERQEKRR